MRLSARLHSLRLTASVAALLACAACNDVGNVAAARAGELRFDNAEVSALPFSEDLKARLRDAWAERDSGYQPRTQHLRPDGTPRYTNRLFLESSPYLLQHAHNPVNWFPWGEEAFRVAEDLNRPVLLSIGYSTCHWCHVMEEESFDDEEIARYINENYIAIKVDREERPDLDAIYMAAVQALTGGGGWPMTVWLTPDRRPFYAGTYFPPRDGDRGARYGFLTLLKRMRQAWDEERDDVATNAGVFVEKIRASLQPPAGDGLPGEEVFGAAAGKAVASFDAHNGGTLGAPKFPSGLPLRFLLRYARRSGEPKYREMAAQTLENIAQGGIHDQAGGGFHRYATDAEWLVPHFEKMLYDNALLTVAYLETYQATGRGEFAAVARRTLSYLERDMMSPEGAFYSATDADSPNPSGEREEGWFFTWTPAEIRTVLNEKEATAALRYYGVSEEGNFEGRNILSVARGVADLAAEMELSADELEALLESAREKLYLARESRPKPLRDEKILTAWNGLAISAFGRAALVFGEDAYAERAAAAAEFVLSHLRNDGRLYRSYHRGAARHNAYLDDYAFLIAGLLDLFEASAEPRWLEEAIALDRVLAKRYEDPAGGFFLTSDDHEELLARQKPAYDGAEPSGNSVAVLNLLRLYELTTEESYRERAERAIRAFEPVLRNAPLALGEMLVALDFHHDQPRQILITTASGRAAAKPFLDVLRQEFVPNHVLVRAREGAPLERLAEWVPWAEGKRAIGGRATAYVCTRGVCKLPASDAQLFRTQLLTPPAP